ncbi:hypothetical protein AAF712_012021 [Marasmius tenuissimus]|uniref:Uncharacterized protein n=1 Tax=Marasmius tenuissimus TaxID=585030 RepID=A0ABR2ZHU7_9AGAR
MSVLEARAARGEKWKREARSNSTLELKALKTNYRRLLGKTIEIETKAATAKSQHQRDRSEIDKLANEILNVKAKLSDSERILKDTRAELSSTKVLLEATQRKLGQVPKEGYHARREEIADPERVGD